MKNYVVTLCIASLLALVLGGCGSSTPAPTPQAEIDKMKADNAKHDVAMADAMKSHAAEAATIKAQARGTTPPPAN